MGQDRRDDVGLLEEGDDAHSPRAARANQGIHFVHLTARQRCWDADWVIDLDIKAFFDSLDHALVERAVAHHTDLPWVRLYIARWLRAPVQWPDGTLEERTKGTPQGGVASPLLANLFLHYAFDAWMQRQFPHIRFERYADDILVHCRSEQDAQRGCWRPSGVGSHK